jgi:hypothetical protein
MTSDIYMNYSERRGSWSLMQKKRKQFPIVRHIPTLELGVTIPSLSFPNV